LVASCGVFLINTQVYEVFRDPYIEIQVILGTYQVF